MIVELCNEHVMASYVHDLIICHMMSDDEIVVELHPIGRHSSEVTAIPKLNCAAKDWHR